MIEVGLLYSSGTRRKISAVCYFHTSRAADAYRQIDTFGAKMITCVVDYVIKPERIEVFEQFAKRWMALVDKHGGSHLGYFLPSEGSSDRALALFSFPSLAAYEKYRALFGHHPDFVAADRIRDDSGCVVRYDRSFMRPLFPEAGQQEDAAR